MKGFWYYAETPWLDPIVEATKPYHSVEANAPWSSPFPKEGPFVGTMSGSPNRIRTRASSSLSPLGAGETSEMRGGNYGPGRRAMTALRPREILVRNLAGGVEALIKDDGQRRAFLLIRRDRLLKRLKTGDTQRVGASFIASMASLVPTSHSGRVE